MYTKTVDLFYNLTPDLVLKSVENLGFHLSGRYSQLNSYENRVFAIELEDENKKEIIAKFYRPGRWSKAAILDEHEFLFNLKHNGIPAIAPLLIENNSVFNADNILLSLFPKSYGRIPHELSQENLKQVGRILARLHNVGAQKPAQHRPIISTEYYGDAALKIIQNLIPIEIADRYLYTANEILDFLDGNLNFTNFIRIHGDCHKGNLLMTDPLKGLKEFFFVDFDDFCMGPPVQDFWMLFSGDNEEQEQEALLSGYTELRDFNSQDLKLIPALRGLRMIYYSSWIAKRWDDPNFPKLFENFKSYNYWAKECEDLEKLLNLLF